MTDLPVEMPLEGGAVPSEVPEDVVPEDLGLTGVEPDVTVEPPSLQGSPLMEGPAAGMSGMSRLGGLPPAWVPDMPAADLSDRILAVGGGAIESAELSGNLVASTQVPSAFHAANAARLQRAGRPVGLSGALALAGGSEGDPGLAVPGVDERIYFGVADSKRAAMLKFADSPEKDFSDLALTVAGQNRRNKVAARFAGLGMVLAREVPSHVSGAAAYADPGDVQARALGLELAKFDRSVSPDVSVGGDGVRLRTVSSAAALWRRLSGGEDLSDREWEELSGAITSHAVLTDGIGDAGLTLGPLVSVGFVDIDRGVVGLDLLDLPRVEELDGPEAQRRWGLLAERSPQWAAEEVATGLEGFWDSHVTPGVVGAYRRGSLKPSGDHLGRVVLGTGLVSLGDGDAVRLGIDDAAVRVSGRDEVLGLPQKGFVSSEELVGIVNAVADGMPERIFRSGPFEVLKGRVEPWGMLDSFSGSQGWSSVQVTPGRASAEPVDVGEGVGVELRAEGPVFVGSSSKPPRGLVRSGVVADGGRQFLMPFKPVVVDMSLNEFVGNVLHGRAVREFPSNAAVFDISPEGVPERVLSGDLALRVSVPRGGSAVTADPARALKAIGSMLGSSGVDVEMELGTPFERLSEMVSEDGEVVLSRSPRQSVTLFPTSVEDVRRILGRFNRKENVEDEESKSWIQGVTSEEVADIEVFGNPNQAAPEGFTEASLNVFSDGSRNLVYRKPVYDPSSPNEVSVFIPTGNVDLSKFRIEDDTSTLITPSEGGRMSFDGEVVGFVPPVATGATSSGDVKSMKLTDTEGKTFSVDQLDVRMVEGGKLEASFGASGSEEMSLAGVAGVLELSGNRWVARGEVFDGSYVNAVRFVVGRIDPSRKVVFDGP